MRVAIVDYGSGNLHSAEKAFDRAARDSGIGATIAVSASPDEIARADAVVLPGVGAFGDCYRGLAGTAGLIEALREAVFDRGRPFLGICVGMQLLATRGLEHGVHAGLDWIPGEVALIPAGVVNDASTVIPPKAVTHGQPSASPAANVDPRLRGDDTKRSDDRKGDDGEGAGVKGQAAKKMHCSSLVQVQRDALGLKVPHMGWNTLDHAGTHPLFEGIPSGETGWHAYFVHSYQFTPSSPVDVVATTNYGATITAAVARGNLAGTQFHPEKSQRLGLKLIANFLRWRP